MRTAIEQLMAFLGRLLHWQTGHEDAPVSPNLPRSDELPPAPSPVPVLKPNNKNMLESFCTAIRDYEGKPGDANYRNNNPGNVRYNPDGYLHIYGNVRRSPAGFAIFPSYQQGWVYLENMLRGMIHKRPNLTIYEFMQRYAPSSENDPLTYALFIGKRLGVDSRTYRIGALLG